MIGAMKASSLRARLPWHARADAVELLESGALSQDDVERNLRDLARFNRLPGGSGASVEAMRRLGAGGPGLRILDVGTGLGDMPLSFARHGWRTVAIDTNPQVLAAARAATAGQPLVEVAEADGLGLPFDDAAFDRVLSCVGVMFAPFHRTAAAELLRVTRPGGTIGLIAWTPAGFIGQMFAAMKPYAPAPPPGAEPPPRWGDEEHVRDLCGDNVTDGHAEVRTLPVARFSSGTEFRDFFKAVYGPTIAVYRNVADDAVRTAALDQALLDLAAGFQDADGAMRWDYLLLTATRA